jgi:hypothetical protein
MERNNLIKKGVVVAVILLFIGLAFAPSINADISKTSVDSEMVEFTTEICGLNGGKNTVSLTRENAEEVRILIDDIDRRLDEVKTREETIEIFNEAIVELDKYGLHGGLSVKQAQKLVTGGYQNLKIMNVIKKMYSKHQEDSNEIVNLFCFVYGKSIVTLVENVFSVALLALYISLIPVLGMGVIFLLLPIMFYHSYLGAKPFSFLNVILLYQPNFRSIGLLGNQKFIDSESEAIMYGFTGIKIGGFEKNNIIIGSTLAICSM